MVEAKAVMTDPNQRGEMLASLTCRMNRVFKLRDCQLKYWLLHITHIVGERNSVSVPDSLQQNIRKHLASEHRNEVLLFLNPPAQRPQQRQRSPVTPTFSSSL